MSRAIHINGMPTEILAEILVKWGATRVMALVCKDWFVIVRRALFEQSTVYITHRAGGISFLRAAIRPTILSLPGSALVSVICKINFQLPPEIPGPRWQVLWQLFATALPMLVRLEEMTLYFRHKGRLMDVITPLIERLSSTVKTLRLVPVREEYYDVVRASCSDLIRCIDSHSQFCNVGNMRINPLDHRAAWLPWNLASWPFQLASLGPVKHLIIVTNMPVVWPPVPSEERRVISAWTAHLSSPKSNLQTIRIQYLDGRVRYPRPCVIYAHGRYVEMLRVELMSGYLQVQDVITEIVEDGMLSEDELSWCVTGNRWCTEQETWIERSVQGSDGAEDL